MAVEPVRVVAYDPRWPRLFEVERGRVEAAIGAWAVRIEHIGSTAVPGLAAKPVLDLLVEVGSPGDADRCIRPLEEIGYAYWAGDPKPYRRYFVRFANADRTARTHNLHVVEAGHGFGAERLLFRDYLRAYPGTAHEYARLKRELAARFYHDREAYTAAKTEFVREVVRRSQGSQP